jgi:S1-C subfamily serine protease
MRRRLMLLRQGVRVSNIARPDQSHWQIGLKVLAFLIASSSFVAAQSAKPTDSAETIAKLKRAVVIVSTEDKQHQALLQGSGFFISADLIVTNMHVIRGAGFITIKTFEGISRNLQNVIAVNEKEDLALLQLEKPEANVEVLQLADSVPAEGEAVMLMSNPRDCQWKLTQGRVGPIWQFQGTGKRIQITALILPGSSGGPVVNQEGRVVGIATMHMEGEDHLNFAVPAESLRALHASSVVAILR